MATQKNPTQGRKGMNRDKAPFDLSNSEYSFALNTNFHDEHGTGSINLQNESSNIYCTGFKPGYKVIGHKYDIGSENTYFFLVNPETGCSEIGYIKALRSADTLEQVEEECNCILSVILENPLENTVQESTCSYYTIINDECMGECNGCLKFDIHHPIHEKNIIIKKEKTGQVMYFTDFKNPQRYIQLDYLEQYTEDIDDCTGEIVTTCLQCDEMRVFPLYNKPCITVDKMQNGGNLRAGTYEAVIAYASQRGDSLTSPYSLTNPIPVFDPNNKTLDQTLLNYQTNFSIKIDISDLDAKYEYFKIFVIYRSGLDSSISVFDYGVYPINTGSINISSLQNKSNLKLGLVELLAKRPFYKKAKGLSNVNGYLWQYGLEAHREINLQKVVSLLGGYVKWSTIQATEDLYENGTSVSKYTSYMRDEVVPASIKFFIEGGYETSLFPFIPRPPKDYEIDELNDEYPSDLNNQSILKYNPTCDENLRNKRWQFENTASIIGRCPVPAGTTYEEEIITREIEAECIVENGSGEVLIVDSTGPGILRINATTGAVNYINDNIATIITSTDPQLAGIKGILSGTYAGTCEPEFGEDCDIEISSVEEIIAYNTIGETQEEQSVAYEEYDRIHAPAVANCASVKTLADTSGDPNTPQNDTSFEATYMRPSEEVFIRNAAPSNINCSTAANSVQFLTGVTFDNSFFFQYKGSLGSIAPLQTTVNTTNIQLPEFSSKIHTNSLWYKIEFNGQEELALELSNNTCDYPDDVVDQRVRVTFFKNCPSPIEVPIYGNIISDINLVNDSNKFYVLQASDFGGVDSTAYISLDTPIVTDIAFNVVLTKPSLVIPLTGTSGSSEINVDGSLYTVTFNIDLATTATDFVTTNAATILGTHGIIVTANVGILTFEGADPLLTISIANIAGDLNGTVVFGALNITIGGTDYLTTYTTNLATTVNNFVVDHQATLLSSQNIIVSGVSNTLKFRSTEAQYNTVLVTTLTGTLTGTKVLVEKYNVLQTTCGCTNIFMRTVETETVLVYDRIDFVKRITKVKECEFVVPILKGCDPIPYQYGLFSYWESTENYPCNEELFNSSSLEIQETDIPLAYRSEFEEYYTNGVSAGEYILKPNTDFRDKAIRHYKFPCSTKVPFMSTTNQNPGDFNKSVIYPIGFSIDNEIINAFLDIAVNNNLITLEERLKITRYEIYRGDRSTDKSIIAKGLLFNMRQYSEANGDQALYPNYPLNFLGPDTRNGNFTLPLNNSFTFHSPETSFSKPSLTNELKIEGYQFGKSGNYFDIVRNHPTWVILGKKAYKLATTLATTEVVLEILLSAFDYTIAATAAGTYPGIVLSIIIAVLAVLALVAGMFKIGKLRYQWLETFKNLGQPRQFAYYQAAIGHYNYFLPNTTAAQTSRGLAIAHYIKDGRISVPNEYEPSTPNLNINNLDREDSVILHTQNFPLTGPALYTNWENGAGSTSFSYPFVGKSGRIIKNAAAPYGAMKQYVPGQYGNIYSVTWVNTGFCGDLSKVNGCDPIFGGDTFISRFALKRKFPFFTNNAFGLAPLTPYKYSDYFNVAPTSSTFRFYVDYEFDDSSESLGGFVFPDNKSVYNLDTSPDTSGFYVKPPGKFYLFSYGFPHFLVESEINCNYRYAKREIHEDFYPNFGDVIENTQEEKISIREPNTYFYNFVYSSIHTASPYRLLPSDYNEEKYSRLANLENTTIYSQQDNSENSLADPWLMYKSSDSHNFPASNGKLIDIQNIESEQALARFENGFTIFGAVDVLRDRLQPETSQLGTSGIFAGRPVTFNKTELGYGGTQHKAMVNCEFGHYWADAKRGKVFNIGANGTAFSEVTEGLEKWFKENLPFKILKSIPNADIDNAYNGAGLVMGWDDRLKRVFLTKKDFIPKIPDILYSENTGYYIETKETESGLKVISTYDEEYFEECSWTLAYSPLTKAWISYYSFLPNYFIGYNDYFQTGTNYSEEESQIGLWSHLSFLSSYQVFYGKLFPFTIETPVASKLVDSVLQSVEYWMESRKYFDKYNSTDVVGFGFNKAWIYNNYQNSGLLNLVFQEIDNMYQSVNYPKHNPTSTDILQTETNGKWTFNYFYNIIKKENSGLPIWKYDCSQIDKILDDRLLDYRNSYKDKLRGDYFLLRLTQDVESRFKMIYRFSATKQDFYE